MRETPDYRELKEKISALEAEATHWKKEVERLRTSEKSLSQIVQETSIPTFVIDKDHVVTHINKAYEKLTGITADKIVGTNNQWMCFYPTKRPTMADLIVDQASEKEIHRYYGARERKSLISEGGYEASALFRDLGTEPKWLFFTASPLKDERGKITGAIETLQDITEQKRAENALRKSEKRLRTLLDFVPYPIVVFSLDGRVDYLNPSFTETFGWTLKELHGKTIPYTPPGLEEETGRMIQRLMEEKVIHRHETRRLTKDGNVLDVVMKGRVYSENEDAPAGEIVILRDITTEKEIARNNEAVLRISTALPEYPDLEELLDYISSEIKQLLVSEGALVILLDQEKDELFFMGAAYDDSDTQRRIKEIRFPVDALVAGQVIKRGEPLIVSDTSDNAELHRERDKKLGYHTRNLLLVPLRSKDRIIGSLCAINKKDGGFDKANEELLSMVAATVALSIENARFSEELKKAYREVISMNRAKDKVINHLSHELKTPVSVLSGSLNILERHLKALEDKDWEKALIRSRRNLDRIMEIQNQVEDIMLDRHYKSHHVVSLLLDQCADELESLLAEEFGEGPHVETIRRRIDKLMGPKEIERKRIKLDQYVAQRLDALKKQFAHRQVHIVPLLEPTPTISMPLDPLQKIVDGLIKNAIENTPDEGKIVISVGPQEDGTEFAVHDYGVGIIAEAQRHIFDGFFATQDTMAYSSKRAFDFNAGGKGADLLRMKIFSERYNLKIEMASTRCRYIPTESDICPGKISECPHCTHKRDCYASGETTFTIHFPPA
jgi:PAS domain S-box-containing protein